MQNIMADPLPLNKIKLPLSFVANNGQEDSRAHFTTSLKNRRIFFSSDRITLVELEPIEESIPEPDDFPAPITEPDEPRNGVALELSFTNANASLAPEGISQLPGHHHFYRGNDSTKWNNGVAHYKELRYPGVWDGVNLELSGSKDGLKMNWLLDSPDRVSSIRLHWAGADSLEIDSSGNLLVHHALGTLTDLAPIAYQEIEGERKPVDCVYRLYGSFDLGFELMGSYMDNVPIVIDPILPYTTYLGGSLTDQCRGIAVDTQGCAYVVGDTTSIDFPVTPGAFQTTNAGVSNVFVTKFSSDGSSLIYSTYLGGSGTDLGYAIALDAQDCSYVTGQTASANFPITPGAFQTTAGGMFVTKLAVDGDSLIYSTFLGSGGTGFGIAVDSQGCSYVTGQGGTIPTTPGAFQTTLTAPVGSVGFITKFSVDGSDLIYSTYLYGNGNGYCQGIALDAYDYAYVTGITNASNFPVTPGAFQTTLTSNAVTVTKLAIDGSSLAYSTFLSGSTSDVARNITVDSQGCAYVTGRTASADFPVTPNAFQTTYGGGSDDVFLTKLSPGGNSLIGSTFLGGDLHDDGFGVALDEYGHAYVTGHTQSSNFPITPNVISSALEGASDAFISIFSSDLTNLIVSYYLGGSGGETGWGIALGPEGEVYTAGVTSSPNFPVTSGAYQTTLNGISDAYVTRTGIAFYRQVSVDIIGY